MLLLFGLISLIGCKKDQNIVKNANAIVYYANTGIIANVCGYLIKIDNTSYYAVNLDDKYQKDQLKVVISYRLLTTKYHCGQLVVGGPLTSSDNGIPEITIITIAKR